MTTSAREQLIERIRHRLDDPSAKAASARAELGDLIVNALSLDYTSESCRGGIQTGNHYQSVNLRGVRTAGFRSDRNALLDQIEFEGRTVLDLGANLGELSRAARARGAARVVGVEYDGFFAAVAEAVTAFNEVDGVEFRQGDIADTSLYGEHFDIVLAFSVFEYVHRVVPEVCAVADELLVVETHKLHSNLESQYLRPIARHLPSYRILGRSDWGRGLQEPGERAVVAFAQDDAALRGALREVAASEQTKVRGEEVTIDVRRTALSLQGRFFSTFAFNSADALLAAVQTTHVDVETMAENADMRHGYRGWMYWFLYLKGYLEYLERGEVDEHNVFCRYFAEHHLTLVDEPGFTPAHAVPVAVRRYRDLDHMRLASRLPDASLEDLAPVRITVSDPPPANPLNVHLADGTSSTSASLVDGWHRLFAAAVCGVPYLQGLVVREHYPRVEGRVERLAVAADNTVQIGGWCLSLESPWAFLEVRVGGRALGRVTARQRPDIAEAFPDTPHASASGFSWTGQFPGEGSVTIDLLPMRDWLPVGRMRVHVVPELSASAREESWGEGMTETELAAASTAFREAVGTLDGTVIAERRPVIAVGRVQEVLARAFLPAAEVLRVGSEPDRWKVEQESCVLVAGGEILSDLGGSGERSEWLSTAARTLAPGGAIVLRHASTLPHELPTELQVRAHLSHEPVRATDSIVLERAVA